MRNLFVDTKVSSWYKFYKTYLKGGHILIFMSCYYYKDKQTVCKNNDNTN